MFTVARGRQPHTLAAILRKGFIMICVATEDGVEHESQFVPVIIIVVGHCCEDNHIGPQTLVTDICFIDVAFVLYSLGFGRFLRSHWIGLAGCNISK